MNRYILNKTLCSDRYTLQYGMIVNETVFSGNREVEALLDAGAISPAPKAKLTKFEFEDNNTEDNSNDNNIEDNDNDNNKLPDEDTIAQENLDKLVKRVNRRR